MISRSAIVFSGVALFVVVAAVALFAASGRSASNDISAARPLAPRNEPSETKRPPIEALYAQAERHDSENQAELAAAIYANIADDYARSDHAGMYLQSVLRLGLYHHATHETERAEARFREVITLYGVLILATTENPSSPPALASDAAAQAQFMLAEQAALEAVSESLGTEDEDELKAVLQRKTQAGQKAQAELEKVMLYDRPRWSIAAYTRMGTLLRAFANSIRSSVMPERLTPAERENYRAVLDESARAVEQNAIEHFRDAVELSERHRVATADTSAARLAIVQLESERPSDVPARGPVGLSQGVPACDTVECSTAALNRSLRAMLSGKYRVAIRHAEAALAGGCAQRCYRVLGMAHHKLEEPEAACRWFAKAKSDLPEGLTCDP